MITTPQSVVQEDVIKSVNLVKRLNITVIGIIENMSGFICPQCKNEIAIFGKGNGEQMSKKLSVPFLGRLPLDVKTSMASDIGTLIVTKEPELEISVRISEIVNKIESKIISDS